MYISDKFVVADKQFIDTDYNNIIGYTPKVWTLLCMTDTSSIIDNIGFWIVILVFDCDMISFIQKDIFHEIHINLYVDR